MWADPDISPVFKEGQAAQTRAVAENLRIPQRVRPEKPLQPHTNPTGPSTVNDSSAVSATTLVIVSPSESLPATEHHDQPTQI